MHAGTIRQSGGHGGCDAVTLDAHRSLVARVLRIDRRAWDEILDQFHDTITAGADVTSRLVALRECFGSRFPESRRIDDDRAVSTCPACGEHALRARFRRTVDTAASPSHTYTYGSCDVCGHAMLLDGAADVEVYRTPAYYRAQHGDGVGYSAYETEREYREGKGQRLVRWAVRHSVVPPESLLEIGSGFGFTRRAAEREGLRTAGVDLNPVAAEAAGRLYGMTTTTGTLAEAMASGALQASSFDLVLYDFVLEHLADPVEELQLACRMLAPEGTLVVRIPGMEALEIIPFGSFYRSFRSDHLHLFTRRSLQHLLANVGLRLSGYETSCGADLLREVLPDSMLRDSYAAGQGPDITLCATRGSHANSPRGPA